MNLSKVAAVTALIAGLLGGATASRAEAFWGWAGSPNDPDNFGDDYQFIIDGLVTGEAAADGIVYKNAVKSLKVFESGIDTLKFSNLDLTISKLEGPIEPDDDDGNTPGFTGKIDLGEQINLGNPEPDTLLKIDITSIDEVISIYAPNGGSVSSPGTSLENFFSTWSYTCLNPTSLIGLPIGTPTFCAEGLVENAKGEQGLFAFENPDPLAFREVEDVPEPTSTVGLLVLGAFGVGKCFKRREQSEK